MNIVNDTFAMFDTKRIEKPKAADDIKRIYETNEKFQEYIKKFCTTTGESVESELKQNIVQEIAKEYEKGGINYRMENK